MGSDPIQSDSPEGAVDPAAPCSRYWRSAAFWYSDIEDAVDRAVCDADHYAPESRAKFLRAVMAELGETVKKLEAENDPTDPR